MKRVRLHQKAIEVLNSCGTKLGCNDWPEHIKHTINGVKVCPRCWETAKMVHGWLVNGHRV